MSIRDDNSGRANIIQRQADGFQRLQAEYGIGSMSRYQRTEFSLAKANLAVYRTSPHGNAIGLGNFYLQAFIHCGLRKHFGGEQVPLPACAGYNNVRSFFLKDHAGLIFQ